MGVHLHQYDAGHSVCMQLMYRGSLYVRHWHTLKLPTHAEAISTLRSRQEFCRFGSSQLPIGCDWVPPRIVPRHLPSCNWSFAPR